MTNLQQHIIKMSNDDIKNSIVNLNKKQLEFIKNSSYLNAINAINTLKNELKNKNNNTGLYTETKILDYYINKAINLLNNPSEIEGVIEVREEISKLLSIIDGYSIELDYVGDLVDHQGIKIMSKRDYDNTSYSPKSIEELIAVINQSLDKVKDDYPRYLYIISQIILILPMRLVKDNYFNIIKDTLMRNLSLYTKSEAENMIEDYKKQFDSSIKDGYGTKFDYYFREIQKLRNLDLSNKSLEELDSLVHGIMDLTKEVNEIFEFILRIGLVMNMIAAITLIDNIIISEEIKEIYNSWIEAMEKKNNEKIHSLKDIIEIEIKKIEGNIFKDLEEFNLLNSEALKRDNFNYDDLNEDLFLAKKVLTFYNDSSLLDIKILFPESNENIVEEYLEQVVDSLLQYVNRSFAKMGNLERKVRMRKLLSKVELPFRGIDEFNNYIRYSLDNKVLGNEEVKFTVDYILYFLNSFVNEHEHE